MTMIANNCTLGLGGSWVDAWGKIISHLGFNCQNLLQELHGTSVASRTDSGSFYYNSISLSFITVV